MANPNLNQRLHDPVIDNSNAYVGWGIVILFAILFLLYLGFSSTAVAPTANTTVVPANTAAPVNRVNTPVNTRNINSQGTNMNTTTPGATVAP